MKFPISFVNHYHILYPIASAGLRWCGPVAYKQRGALSLKTHEQVKNC